MTSKTNIDKYTYYFLFFLLVLHIILLANTKFTLWPEMVVYPYLLNNNFLLYKDIINPYPPALSYFLGHFSKIFGYYPLPYELFTWAVVILTDILVFILATKITKRFFLGLLSASFFIIFSIPFGINGLWFDIIQTPFILLSIYFFYKFLKDDKTKHLSWSFLLLFVAIFIKQQVAWLMPWYLFFMINCKKFNLAHDFKKILPMLILVTLVSAMHLLFFYKIGTLNEFLFWNINFPLLQASKSPGYILLPTFRQTLFFYILVVFDVSCGAGWGVRKNKEEKNVIFFF